MAVHVNVSALGLNLDSEGVLRARVEIALYCDACLNHLDLPVDASPTSVPFADLDQVVTEHEAGRHR